MTDEELARINDAVKALRDARQEFNRRCHDLERLIDMVVTEPKEPQEAG